MFLRALATYRGLVILHLLTASAWAADLVVDPPLTPNSFAGTVFVPFIYNIRTNEFHWTIGAGAETAEGKPHPQAYGSRTAVHAAIFQKLGLERDADWSGGGFHYNPKTGKLFFFPGAGGWSVGTNASHWNGPEELRIGLLPWQHLAVSMIAAQKALGTEFEPNPRPEGLVQTVKDSMRMGHQSSYPAHVSPKHEQALADYYEFVARDPAGAIAEALTQKKDCAHLIASMADQPTQTPAVLNRFRLDSGVLK